MNHTTQTITLKHALDNAAQVADSKATIPALAAVLLQPAGSAVRVSATDGDVSLEQAVEAEGENNAPALVPARQLREVVAGLGGAEVRLVSDGDVLRVASGSYSCRLPTLPASEFPELPDPADAEPIHLDPSVLSRVLPSASSEDVRANLCGVHVESADGTLYLIATDGHRLAVASFESATQVPAATLPSKGLRTALRLSGDDPVSLAIGERTATVRAETATLTMRLVEGSYPNWRQVVPEAGSVVVDCAASDLLSALKRVALVSAARSYAVTMSVGETLHLASEDPEFGEATEDVPGGCTGSLSIGVNARFLADAIRATASSAVRLNMADELSPILVRPAEAESWVGVVMPMRV